MQIQIAFAAAILIPLAHADGQQVHGPSANICPMGQITVQVSLGQKVIYRGCFSEEELERAAYKTTANEVICRTLIVRSN